MRVDLAKLKSRLEPLATAQGAELVALEWMQGPGRGLLRVTIDVPGGDPRLPRDPARPGATADLCAGVSRKVSASLDEEDFTEMAYDLEVSSPGLERPVQKREDFDRFAGLVARVRVKPPRDGRATFEGTLRGTEDDPSAAGGYVVKLETREGEVSLPIGSVTRANLAEIPAPTAKKSPRAHAPSRRPAKGDGPTSGG